MEDWKIEDEEIWRKSKKKKKERENDERVGFREIDRVGAGIVYAE